MKGDRIPDQDHVARLCWPSKIENGQIQAPAFHLKTDEDRLSVNWLEYFNFLNRESEISELRQAYSNKNLTVRRSAKIAVLNVGEVLDIVQRETSDGRILNILHDPIEVEGDPSQNDPSHSGIYGMRPNNEEIAELILQTNPEIYPALN